MTDFVRHTLNTAPEGSCDILIDIEQNFGFIPNLHKVLSESPPSIRAYQDLAKHFQSGSLSSDQQNVVWLTVSYVNKCTYCVPAHTMIALASGLSPAHVENLREGRPLSDKKLQALRLFTEQLVMQRGDLFPKQINDIRSHGFTSKNLLDIVVGVAQKTISNFANHMSKVEPDIAFASHAWIHPDER